MKNGINVLEKINVWIRRHHVLLLAFFVPALILEIAYITCGIFPFGKWNLLIIDLYHQYAPFISDFQDRLRSFSSLLYSWSGGLGASYLPLYAYYLASPLNLLTVLFPKANLTEAVLVLTLLKVGLSGLCFALYLREVHREQSLLTVAFSLLYALSGFVLAYSWNIMWMDTIYLLPVIILGLVRLVRDARGLLYCLALAAALVSNFYMAFFVCLFTMLYYPVCLFQYHGLKHPALLARRTARFAGFSLLSGGLSAVLVLPTYFALKLSSAADDTFPRTLTHYYDLFDYITRHFTAATPTIREGMPNLYSGLVVLILLPVYFFSKSIRLKEKLWHLALLLLLIISFNLSTLNFIWHGFHFPNQLPFRFSFVYIFLVLSMGYQAARRLHEFTGKQLGMVCLSILGLVVLSQKLDKVPVDWMTVYASVACVVLYAAALTADRSEKIPSSWKLLLLALVMLIEMTANTIMALYRIDSVESYSIRDGYASGKEVAQIRRQLKDIAVGDKDFYRLEIMPPKTTNDPFLYNYRGLSIFSSTAPLKPVRMLQNLGYHSNSINSYIYEGSTAILDSLFGIKYLLYRSQSIDEKLYRQIASADKVAVYENPYALPLGFQAPAELKNFRSSMGSNPFDVQNRLMEGLTGVKDLLLPVEQKQGTHDNLTIGSSGTKYYSFTRPGKDQSSTARILFTIDKDRQVYLYYRAPSGMKGSGFVMLNDKKVNFNPRHSTLINLGFCKAGTRAELQVNFEKESRESGRFETYACSLDVPAFEKAVSLIREKAMTVDSFEDTRIHGRVETDRTGLMVMSIPYDKGWHVKVDGQEVATRAVDDCLLAFELTEGSHRIELRFFPDKLMLGLIVTLASLFIFLLLLLRRINPGFLQTDKMNRGFAANEQVTSHIGHTGI